MTRTTIALIVLVVAGFWYLSADSEPGPAPRAPTDQTDSVLTNTKKERDCSVLQAIFDNYDASDHPNKVSYMTAADNQMKTVGCYNP